MWEDIAKCAGSRSIDGILSVALLAYAAITVLWLQNNLNTNTQEV